MTVSRGGMNWALPLAVLVALAGAARGEEPNAAADEERAAHRARVKEVAGSIRVYASAERTTPVELAAEPVLRYSDSTRAIYESTLWVWGTSGRPAAMVAIEFYPDRPERQRWLYEIASLSAEPIAADRGPELSWTADEGGLALQDIDRAPAVAGTPARRLTQMKELWRRFTAHESAVIEGRIELRPLAQPLVRYTDDALGVTDGAIFAFANGTNPEVLLLLEARAVQGDAPARWQFSLAQMTGGAVAVQLDGAEIWTRIEADPPATRPSYVNGWLAAESVE